MLDDVLPIWGKAAHPPVLVAERENSIYRVTLTDGRVIALRLHRSGYQSRAGIAEELRWTDALADAGFPCPRPVRTRDGHLVAQTDPPASAVSWIEAAPIRNLPATPALFHELGGLIRRLHDLTREIRPQAQHRPRWDRDGFLGQTPHWGRFWQNPSLSPAERDFMLRIRENAAQHFATYAAQHFHLIHADLLGENILKSDRLHIIDFDDSGLGPPHYDLATALIQHAESPDLDQISAALSDGYKLSSGEYAELSFFMMLRSMASAGWIISRAQKTDPRQRFYAARMLRCAEKWQAE